MNSSLTRREILRLGAAGLVALGLWPRRLPGAEKNLSGDFSFIAVNDLHFSNSVCRPWFDRVVAEMKRTAPNAAFCLLGGDLADTGLAEQLVGIRDAFKKLGIPVYAVPGNHDYQTATDRVEYERIFPKQINYCFDYQGWQLIGLDTTEGTKSTGTVVSDVTLHWLDENVPKLDRDKPTIVFTHFPLNVFVPVCPLNAGAVLQRCARLNLQAIFSGHFHGYTEGRFADALMTTDRCCSRVRGNHDRTPEKGWFLCQASNGRISRTFVEFQPPA